MGKHLILVGGGHAHLAILNKTREFTARGHRVTLVSPSPFHDYSGVGPGLLSGRYRLAEARFNVARMAAAGGGHFVEASAAGIDPANRRLILDDGTNLGYNVISFNCGSRVAFAAPDESLGKTVFPVKPIANLYHARQRIIEAGRDSKKPRLLVIGGGPAGCEVTGNLQELVEQERLEADIVLVAGARLLDSFGEGVRERVRSQLSRRPIRLLEGIRVSALQARQADLDDGRSVAFDFCFLASGIAPAGPFAGSPLAGGGNGLRVNSFLHSPFHPDIFGGGDCIDYLPRPLDKVGVYAVRQSPVLHHNLMAALEDRAMIKFQAQTHYLLIFNLGLNRALATGYGVCWTGRSALYLKSFLDRRFIRSFREHP